MAGKSSTAASTSSWNDGGSGTATQSYGRDSNSSRTRMAKSPEPWMIGKARTRGPIARKSSAEGRAGGFMGGLAGRQSTGTFLRQQGREQIAIGPVADAIGGLVDQPVDRVDRQAGGRVAGVEQDGPVQAV